MQHLAEGGRSEMKSDGTMICSVAVLACTVISNILAVTNTVVPWQRSGAGNSKFRTERWPDVHATPFTFQPEILSRLESEPCSCIEATLCPEFLETLARYPAQSEDLRRVTCGFKGFCPLVCCNQLPIYRHVDTSYFPTSGPYPEAKCNHVTTVEPRINLSPTPYHTPGVYYHTTTARYLNSATRRKTDEETGQPNSNNVFYQDTRLGMQDNSFVTPSTSVQGTPNTSTRPNFMSSIPATPDYYIKTQADPAYSHEGSQHYPNNSPELYPQSGHPISTPNYPHRYVPSGHWGRRTPYDSYESDRRGYNPEENYSSHNNGMHSNHNPTVTVEGGFQPQKDPSLYATNGYSNHQQSYPGVNHPPTPNYGYDPRKHTFNPSEPHTQPSVGAHQDGFGFKPYQHNHFNQDQHFHEESHTVLPPRFSPSDTKKTPPSPEMKIVPSDSDAGSAGRQWKRRLLPTDECGVSLGERIVGGKNAVLGAYPWMSRIGYKRSGSDTFFYRCGGSLINDRYVITAAHCVINLPGGLRLASVRLGELDERTDPDCDQSECADEVQDFSPTVVKVHKDYDRPKFRNDLALIRLDKPVNITPYVSPICLPFDSLRNKTYTGLRSFVAGWGATDLGVASSSPVLQWATVTVVPSVSCAKVFAERTGTQLGLGQICAGGEKGRDSCEGDSGGPLMRGEDEFQRYFLLGVVSFGARRCGSENLPGVYTDIPAYLDWILDNMEP